MNTLYNTVRQTYGYSTDEELIHLFLFDLTTLIPDARHALEDELYSRSLLEGLDIQAIIDAQLHPTREAIEHMVIHLSHLPCPVCRKTDETINAYEFPYENTYNQSKTKQYTLFIGCSAYCYTVARQTMVSLVARGLLDPLLLPFSIYKSIRIHFTTKRRNNPAPTIDFKRFAEQNAGAIVAYRDNPSALFGLLCLPHFRSDVHSVFV